MNNKFYCKSCSREIVFNGSHWEHVGKQYRHPPTPRVEVRPAPEIKAELLSELRSKFLGKTFTENTVNEVLEVVNPYLPSLVTRRCTVTPEEPGVFKLDFEGGYEI